MTAFSLRLSNAPTRSASCTQRPPTQRGSGVPAPTPSWRDHQRGPLPTLARRAVPRPVRGAGRGPGSHRRRATLRTASGSGSSGSPTSALWNAHLEQKLELAYFARGRLRSQLARHGEAPDELRGVDECLDPDDPDHRLRAPVRDLQARRRCSSPTRSGWRGCCGTRSGPSRSSSRARPIRPTGPGQRVIQDIFSRSRSSRLKGRVVILEDYDIRVGALPGAGRGRVAEQPAPAAGGVAAPAA